MRPGRLLRWFVVLVMALSSGTCLGQSGQTEPLEIRLASVPLDFEQLPLRKALERIALGADHDLVLFGVEVHTEYGREPLVSVHIPGGSTLRQALAEVVATLPNYTFEIVSPHLINVFPRTSLNDPDNLLNLNIPSLNLPTSPPAMS